MAGEKKRCHNKCIFCFIDQLPKGLREALYFKDDDERLSFLHGNYVTLTNMEDFDIDRIIDMRISPINISVHTTNPALRAKMTGNPRAGEVLGYIKKLSDADIDINAQIVLCKNINDGSELKKTLADLSAIPAVQSVAAVPAGQTKHREENGLFKLEPFGRADCEKIIETVDEFGEENLKKRNSRLIYCADEFYLKAEKPIPDAEYYEDYPQYENGVGMIRSFVDEFYQSAETPGPLEKPRRVSLATGEAAYGTIKALARELEKRHGNLSCGAYKIKNDFFGQEVTVAGLVTGGDIIAQLAPCKNSLGEELLLPAAMLRHERDLFLDGATLEDVENALGTKVSIVENNAADFIKKVMGK